MKQTHCPFKHLPSFEHYDSLKLFPRRSPPAVELCLLYCGGVLVNAIAQGVFLTEQNRNLLIDPDGNYSERTSRYINNTPYRRLGNPEELTGTLIYLLSDASGFVTGETILVDGGFNAFSGV